MRKMLALVSVVGAAASSAVGVGAAAAAPQPQPHGCPAYGQFMGASASSSAENQWPLGQVVRQLTPFNDALAVFKTGFCG